MKLHIYLFRHGQTYYNRAHRFTGWKDSRLTLRGVQDARKVALRLRNKKIDVAYQTRLSRSRDTLRQVLSYHPECKKVISDDRMIERSYGTLQGKTHSAFVQKLGERDYKTLLHWHTVDHLHGKERSAFVREAGEFELQIVRRSYNARPPRGESIKMVEKRVLAFIRDLFKIMKKEKVNVAIAAHGNSMRPFRRYFEHLSVDEMMRLENPFDDYFEYVVDI
jgi:2,3-bisphosphoglycerate-dependent phosphoglycerate mutase